MIGIGNALEQRPEMAEDPKWASLLLVAFIKSKEQLIRQYLNKADLKSARTLVNTKALGLDRFSNVYNKVRLTLSPPNGPRNLRIIP
jgi:hypothetical protein